MIRIEPLEMENENRLWLEQLKELILDNISSNFLTNKWLAVQLLVSERNLYREVQKLTGLPPNRYIRKLRMQKAKELLESGQFAQVKEVAAEVGFRKAEYFSQLFKEEFGLLPSEILRKEEPN